MTPKKKSSRKPASKKAARSKPAARKPSASRKPSPKKSTATRASKPPAASDRLPVQKTCKLFIRGELVRSESGRALEARNTRGEIVAHCSQASRKDLHNAVQAARDAFDGWASRPAYNRGQILYRMAEMLESRAEEFAGLLAQSISGGAARARKETAAAVDRLIAFAGWADKFAQVLGCRNPVAGAFYNFTNPEPTGVVGVAAPDREPLLTMTSLLAPPLCAGNTLIVLASEKHPIVASVFGEVCATSDLPPGAVNLLTGLREALLPILAEHREVDAIHAAVDAQAERKTLELGAAVNLKRVKVRLAKDLDWYSAAECQSPEWIEPFLEMKTVWHPAGT